VAGAVKKLIVEERLDVAENLRLAGRVKAMAAVIDRYAVQLEAAGVASDVIALFQDNGDRLAAAGQLPCGPDPCRACAQYRYSPVLDGSLDLLLCEGLSAVWHFSPTVYS
jgi:hypothetical protein